MHQNMSARLCVEKERGGAAVDPRIYGSFLEHIGRAVYGGIYEPSHPKADKNGCRTDVLEAVKLLGVPLIRYPGGNFVSGYNWEDGIGPRELRPRRLELAWLATETNQFGTDDFAAWAAEAGARPMLAVNLGTRGMDAARNLVEYCNHPGGTYWSDLRRKNGYDKPHGIKTWCLGNEMDGAWQIGTKTAAEYGRIARETGKLMKLVDPDIELVACGSSCSTMPTFPAWEAEVLEQCYEQVDYISMHQYYDNWEGNLSNFLAKSLDMDRFIRRVISTCDMVAAKKRISRRMYISFDEWNVWYHSQATDRERPRWQAAGPRCEEAYTAADALVFGCMLITLLKHADRVRIACLAQLVNVLAPIMTETGGGMWFQTIFYPYLHALRHGSGVVLDTLMDCPKYDSKDFCDVPYVEHVTLWDEEKGELTLFAVNRSQDSDITLDFRPGGWRGCRLLEHVLLDCSDTEACNTLADPGRVVPRRAADGAADGNTIACLLPRLSWNMIRFAVNP